MELKLVVVRPFAGRVRGDVITDPEEAGRVLAGEQADSVVRVLIKPAKES